MRRDAWQPPRPQRDIAAQAADDAQVLLWAQEGDVNKHAALARAVLQSDARTSLLQQCSHLCPIALTDLPPMALATARQAHTSTLERLREVEDEVQAARGTPGQGLTDDALLRLVMAIQMNALESGLYLELAMINHSCRPNCVKITPATARCAVHAVALQARAVLHGGTSQLHYLNFWCMMIYDNAVQQKEVRCPHLMANQT